MIAYRLAKSRLRAKTFCRNLIVSASILRSVWSGSILWRGVSCYLQQPRPFPSCQASLVLNLPSSLCVLNLMTTSPARNRCSHTFRRQRANTNASGRTVLTVHSGPQTTANSAQSISLQRDPVWIGFQFGECKEISEGCNRKVVCRGTFFAIVAGGANGG